MIENRQTAASNNMSMLDMDELLADLLPNGAHSITVADGEDLCRLGDPADMWWYVDEGWADVTVDGIFIGNVGAGETIGEVAVLDGRPRSATVTARGPMSLRVASADDLLEAIVTSPNLGLTLTKLIVRRLRDANERMSGSTVSQETPPAVEPEVAVPASTPAGRVEFNPFEPGYFEDPTVQLGVIREQEAVHFIEMTGAHLLTRYEHVQAIARDRRLGNSIAHALPNPVIDAEREMIAEMSEVESILRVDGDDQTRVRRVMQKAFTPKAIAKWRERTITITDELIDSIGKAGGGDLIGDFALTLPIQIISDMLGMSTDDVPRLREWSHIVSKTLDPICSPEERAAAVEANACMNAYILDVYEQKRRTPDDGLLSVLIEAEDDGDRLSQGEVLINTALLYIAGHETTTNLIGNGAVELFRRPDQRQMMVTRPDLDANLVEEVLRFNSPVQMTRRISVEDIEVDGTEIPAGSVVLLSAAAANRDPGKWGADADSFMIDRQGANDQVSFGGGPHFCLGAALARLEGQIALPRLFRRLPNLRVTSEPVFEPRIVLRGVGSLQVEC